MKYCRLDADRHRVSNPSRVAARLPRARSGLSGGGLPAPGTRATDVSSLLAPGDITAVTQPIVRVADGQTVGFEVLARSRSFSFTSPDQWLASAEEAGCRTEVELACLRAGLALGTPPGGARLFLNASAGLLLDSRIDDLLAAAPEHVLEVTEHERIADYAPLTERLVCLARSGTLLAVDDVGAGYANMAHVLRLSPHFIKIDRSIVSGLHRDRDRRALIAALVAFGVACGAQTVAEGVEEAAELNALGELGVDLVQGYLIARPATGWPEPARTESGCAGGATKRELALLPLASRVERAGDVQTLADVVTGWLHEEHRLMPSVYVERGGVLRCLSRRGQWIVHDGMAPGVGITGRTFARDQEAWVPDVRADPSYRAAIPGVRSEFSVPLHAGGRRFGVLNVESYSELSLAAREHTRQAALLLEGRLDALGPRRVRDNPLRALSRSGPAIASAGSRTALAERGVAAAIDVSGLSSAALWWYGPNGAELGAAAGPALTTFAELDPASVEKLFAFAVGVTSCHTGGGPRDLAASFLGASFEAAARAMLVIPLRGHGSTLGLLVATSGRSRDISTDVVEATELLGLHIAAIASGYPSV
jgi:EAL domain-containing protein (putative c-di-GMP-specific phosphodiesterase class I)